MSRIEFTNACNKLFNDTDFKRKIEMMYRDELYGMEDVDEGEFLLAIFENTMGTELNTDEIDVLLNTILPELQKVDWLKKYR